MGPNIMLDMIRAYLSHQGPRDLSGIISHLLFERSENVEGIVSSVLEVYGTF